MGRLPDFHIIGAMKAATSTLHDQLAAIDGIHMSDPKELYFFSDDPVYARGLDWYAAHFDAAGPDDIVGESTTHYAKLPTHPATIGRLLDATPDVRVIYVMRHPIDRLVSQFTHMWLEREIAVDFDEAVDGAVPELVDYSRYAYQLRPWLEAIGPDRVLPVFFDRLRAHGDDELRRVVRFVGFDDTRAADVRWQDLAANNVSSERLRTSRVRDTIKAVPGYERVRSLVSEDTMERIRRRWKPGDTPEVDPIRRRRLTEVFDDDLAELGDWLGVALTTDTFVDTTVGLADPTWTAAVPRPGSAA